MSAIVDIAIELDEELDEAAVAARIASGDIAALRDARALDGVIRIGEVEIGDELFSAVQRLCFEGAAALLVDGAVVDYLFFSSNGRVRLVAAGDAVELSGDQRATFPRLDLIRALVACGIRYLAMLDQVGRTADANHLRPYAASATATLTAAGLV